MAYQKSARIIQKNVYAWTDNLPAKSLSLQEPTRRHLPKVDCVTDFVRMHLKKTYIRPLLIFAGEHQAKER